MLKGQWAGARDHQDLSLCLIVFQGVRILEKNPPGVARGGMKSRQEEAGEPRKLARERVAGPVDGAFTPPLTGFSEAA